MDNILVFSVVGIINEITEENFSVFLEKVLNKPELPILICVNSDGGSYTSAISIHNILSSMSDRVKILVTGRCAEAANLIFLSAPYEKRYAYVHSSISVSDISVASAAENIIAKDILASATDISEKDLNFIFSDNSELTYLSYEFGSLGLAKVIEDIKEICKN